MGIYDREYIREDSEGGWLSQRTMVINLVLLNVAIYIANMVIGPSLAGKTLTDWMALSSDSLAKPWLWWQLLTYGFAHDPNDVSHILFNMLTLWVFGRDVEARLGRWEFLRVYLAMIVFSGLVFALIALASGPASVIGASGAVMGVIMLFILPDPKRTLMLMGVVAMPAWLLGLLFMSKDIFGIVFPSRDRNGPNVAHVAHLAGVAFAFMYFRGGWNLGRFAPRGLTRRLPKLRVHSPTEDEPEYRDLGKAVDKILEKISREGEASLTKKERQTLEEASRRYQRRRS